MTTTESVSTPLAAWSGVDVLYASAGEDGPQLTVWCRPAPSEESDDPVEAVARAHADTVAEEGGWVVHDTTTRDDGRGGSYVVRTLTPAESGATPATAAAAYWAGPAGVTVAVARTERDDDLMALLDEFVAASAPRHVLSAEEVHALCEVTALAPPPLGPTAYPQDAPDEVRAAAHHAARMSLVARGLLVPDGAGLTPVPDLAASLRLLLDGDRSLLVSRTSDDGSSGTSLLGGRDGVVAELAPGPQGTLELSVGAATALATRYAAWLGSDATPPDAASPFRAGVEEVRASVGGSTGPERLRGARSLASVRGLRRQGEDLSVFEATWLVDAHGTLWSVTPTDDLVTVLLTPVDAQDVSGRVHDALDVPHP